MATFECFRRRAAFLVVRTVWIALVLLAFVGMACGGSKPGPDPTETLLLGWDRLSGRIAYIAPDGETVRVIDAAKREVRTLVVLPELNWPTAGPSGGIAWHPNGDRFAASFFILKESRYKLFSIDVATGSPTPLYSVAGAHESEPAWSSGGALAYRCTYDLCVDGDSVAPLVMYEFLVPPTWSPDGATLVIPSDTPNPDDPSQYRYGLLAIDVATKAQRTILTATDPREKEGISGPMFSPDGQRVAYLRYTYTSPNDTRVALWTVRSDGTGASPVAEGNFSWPFAWSPDGHSIVFAARPISSTTTQLFLVDVQTGVLAQLTALGGAYPMWLP